MKTYQVIAQSNAAVIMEVVANDIFEAADKVDAEMNVEIMCNAQKDIGHFENDSDYYTLASVE